MQASQVSLLQLFLFCAFVSNILREYEPSDTFVYTHFVSLLRTYLRAIPHMAHTWGCSSIRRKVVV